MSPSVVRSVPSASVVKSTLFMRMTPSKPRRPKRSCVPTRPAPAGPLLCFADAGALACCCLGDACCLGWGGALPKRMAAGWPEMAPPGGGDSPALGGGGGTMPAFGTCGMTWPYRWKKACACDAALLPDDPTSELPSSSLDPPPPPCEGAAAGAWPPRAGNSSFWMENSPFWALCLRLSMPNCRL